ncbi:acyl-CoA dehydrogenase family protein [Spirillospora sp. NBC_01491]|uniref:acyl-CoA dehydrogenase family protein n=1 Tax=Spirillospora sp. NBC_01491 TaxID=2976007 RepID=UPI002E31A30E|nr:acyl-CoA dehydrogenase family protein [Spirillospora sp. NBC_01491]
MEYGEALLGRARDLAPVLADRARNAEDARRLPDETVADLAGAGLLDVLVPRSLGGAGLGLDALVGACREIGRGCTSTGWVTAVYALHNWMLALFPEQARREVFADRPYTFAPCTLAPTGTAEPVDGGHRVTGRWSWGSGAPHAEWVMVDAIVAAGETVEPRIFLIPREDVTVHDVWHTSGMRGTGSNDLEVTDRFVPAHRSVPLRDFVKGTTPGADDHAEPAARWPMVPVLVLAGAAPVLGAAEGTLARFRDRLQERVIAYTGARQRDLMSGQMRLAKSTADLAAARLLLDDAVARLDGTYASGGRFGLPDRAWVRLTGGHVVGTARTAVNELCAAGGASIQFLDSPLQRAQRDINTISGHVVFDLDATYGLFGKVDLGVDPDPTTLV